MHFSNPSVCFRSADTQVGDLKEVSDSKNGDWKHELLHSYTSVEDLLSHELITSAEAEKLRALGDQFKVRITPYYSKIMTPSPDCPIRLQALPHLGEEDPLLPNWAAELSQEIYGRKTPWQADAIGDVRNLAAPRLTHRYENRAILHLSSLCAVYCRFCFRKSHLNNHEEALYQGSLDPAFHYLENERSIQELILTGGDPLSVSDNALKKLFERISRLRHIRVVRIHTRMAVTLPFRVTESLLKILGAGWNFNVVLVSHFNHPSEITPEAKTALRNLRLSGVTLLNQSVLLRGVNDTSECLGQLFQGLYEQGVLPFYLHHPDWTPGTFHFRVGIEKGKQLFAELKGLVSGPCLPDYTLDIPGGYGKVSLLDTRHRMLKNLPDETLEKGSLRGAVYEVIPPRSKAQNKLPLLYLDLFHT